ncbi:MAG: methyltransferase domain-containing protein [Burkholderiaceae bacterium]
MSCSVCGASDFVDKTVLWPKLIADWQLGPEEVAYVDAQQGTCCKRCGANLRSIALARALIGFIGADLLLRELPKHAAARSLSLLELNEAGTLSPILRQMPRYTFGAYPAVDMHALPYADASFDLVVHSDTLEHVEHPVHALTECARVLKPGGALCFTVPTIVGRMSRNRRGLAKSYHGNEAASPEDFVVHTEFGSDAWTLPLEAGFTRVEIFAVKFPAGIAYLARR